LVGAFLLIFYLKVIAGATVKIQGVLAVSYSVVTYFKGIAFLIFPAWPHIFV